ncbi:hypothetical protein RhiJN_16513 [Ceratobasidium sp. AG-Ba]|nr:hypothetical protein RhiJN_16513 [Ceratobasidium sp. AG-Ba]
MFFTIAKAVRYCAALSTIGLLLAVGLPVIALASQPQAIKKSPTCLSTQSASIVISTLQTGDITTLLRSTTAPTSLGVYIIRGVEAARSQLQSLTSSSLRRLSQGLPSTRAWMTTKGYPPPRPGHSRPRRRPFPPNRAAERLLDLTNCALPSCGTLILVGWVTAALTIWRMAERRESGCERGIRSAAPLGHLLDHEHHPPPSPPPPPPPPPVDPIVVVAEPDAPARRLWCLYDITIEMFFPEFSPEPLLSIRTKFPYSCIPRLQTLAENSVWETIDNDLWALQKKYRIVEDHIQYGARATRELRVCELRRKPNGRFGWFPVTEEVEFSSSLEEIMENMSRRARLDLWLEEEHRSGPASPTPSPPPSPMLPPLDDAHPLMQRRIVITEPGQEDGDMVGVNPRWRERVILG